MAPPTIQPGLLASAYRGLISAFGLYVALFLGFPLFGIEADWASTTSIVSVGAAYLMLFASFASLYYGYRTASEIGSKVAALWAIGLCIPGVGVVVLLLLSLAAARACRAAGVPIGLLGPKT